MELFFIFCTSHTGLLTKQFFNKTSYSLSLKSYPAPRTEMSPFVASRKYLHLCEFYKLERVKNKMIYMLFYCAEY